MYDHIKIHKCLHYCMKLVHAVHNRVIFYIFFPRRIDRSIYFGRSCSCFFFRVFVDLSFITFLNINSNNNSVTATNFSFYSYLLIIILTMITQKKSMDVSCVYAHVVSLIRIARLSIRSQPYLSEIVLRDLMPMCGACTYTVHICTYCVCVCIVMYTRCKF